jgi:hypothetical protein
MTRDTNDFPTGTEFGATINPEFIPIAVHHNDANNEFPTVIDNFTISEHIAGYCHYLAAAIHEITGWTVYEERNVDHKHVHSWALNDNNQAVDINGAHNGNWAATKYSKKMPEGIIITTEQLEVDDLLSIKPADLITSYDSISWARDIVNKYPELFGITIEIK